MPQPPRVMAFSDPGTPLGAGLLQIVAIPNGTLRMATSDKNVILALGTAFLALFLRGPFALATPAPGSLNFSPPICTVREPASDNQRHDLIGRSTGTVLVAMAKPPKDAPKPPAGGSSSGSKSSDPKAPADKNASTDTGRSEEHTSE